MKKEKILPEEINENGVGGEHFIVQLDEHTVVTVRRLSSFERWKEKYPKARILQTSTKAA